MSYCRFCEGDVYAYDSCDGGVQFYVSGGSDRKLDRLCATYSEAYQYIKALRDEHGLNVPEHAIEALRADAMNELIESIMRVAPVDRGDVIIALRRLGIEVK